MSKKLNNYPPRNVSYTPINMMSFYYWFRVGKTKDLGTIYCEIRVDGEKSVPISTKIKLNRKQWNPKEQCFQGKEAPKIKSSWITMNYVLPKSTMRLVLKNPTNQLDLMKSFLDIRIASGKESFYVYGYLQGVSPRSKSIG
jgi:hypothetical protein